MTFSNPSSPTGSGFERIKGERVTRPQFNSQKTSDRLREGTFFETRPFIMGGGNIRKGRRSVFKETGLDDEEHTSYHKTSSSSSSNDHELYTVNDEKSFGIITGLRSELPSDPKPSSPTRESSDEQHKHKRNTSNGGTRLRRRQNSDPERPWYAKLYKNEGRPRVQSASGAPPGGGNGLARFTMIAMLIAIVIPAFNLRSSPAGGKSASIADAGPVMIKREDSPTDVCIRWAHQSAHLDGTIYVYGGQARQKQDPGSEENNWNNYFLQLDVTKDWSTKSPALKGLPVPDGPPDVSMGYLWNDYDNLYLYGGQFSTAPYVDPEPESIWKYSIDDQSWTEWKDPKTSKGKWSTDADQPVRRAAEGAGLSVPELGRSWYFGGHLDWATVPGWTRGTDRVYLKSLLEFTHPGYVNDGVDDLSDGTGAGPQGAFRNITEGGVQDEFFPERADGALVYVPGWGDEGVLIGLAGGTAEDFVDDLKQLDVYDIANSEWFHQKTTGDIPSVRVNPCAVVAGAKDGSSFQVYMFGGQNLVPQGEQIQYDDMYILSIPAFTWIKVKQPEENRASGRAGHTCTMRDGQIIIVGGYIGNGDECDTPGIHVFDATTLKWKDKFEAGDHDNDFSSEDSVRGGSFGYKVPTVVQEAIGGNEEGGAEASTPSESPTGGPFKTGKAPVVTITNAGATATVTQPAGTTGAPSEDNSNGGNGGDDSSSGSSDSDDPNPGLIAAGVIAGVTGALALYLGFCAWLYRRQVTAYQQHLAITNRYGTSPGPAGMGLFGSRRGRGRTRDPSEHSSFGWVGSGSEPRWLSEPKFVSSEDASPGTASGSGVGGGSGGGGGKNSEETRPRTSGSGSGDELLEGQEPSFFSVVMGPRRALRVVNHGD